MAPSDDVEALFADRMRQRREQLGISTRGFAGRMRDRGFDWHHTTVQRTEQAKRPIRLAEASSVAAILDVNLEYLTTPINKLDREIPQVTPEMLAEAESEVARLQAGFEQGKEIERKARERYHQAEVNLSNASKESAQARLALEAAKEGLREIESLLINYTSMIPYMRTSLQAEEELRDEGH